MFPGEPLVKFRQVQNLDRRTAHYGTNFGWTIQVAIGFLITAFNFSYVTLIFPLCFIFVNRVSLYLVAAIEQPVGLFHNSYQYKKLCLVSWICNAIVTVTGRYRQSNDPDCRQSGHIEFKSAQRIIICASKDKRYLAKGLVDLLLFSETHQCKLLYNTVDWKGCFGV